MANIVVFGKAQSGKSTLLGYLYSELTNFNIFEFEKKMSAELLKDFEPSYLYAYIMDKSKYERVVKKGTRNIHVRKVRWNDETQVTIIDTPGVEHHSRQKQKGAFLGDVGIFCLELRDVISENFMFSFQETSSILSTLLFWSNLGHKRIIVALTKCDELDFSEDAFLTAQERIHFLCGELNIDNVIIIPISINVCEKKGMNIIEKSEEFAWYKLKTLYSVLKDEIELLESSNNNDLLFCVHSQIAKSNSNAGKVWMIKIIQGSLSINDKIKLSPVLTKNHEFVSIDAVVKTIRDDLDKSESVQKLTTASEGEIVGIDIKNIYNGNEKIDKKSFDTIYTTCGFKSDVKYVTSDFFVFSTEISHANLFTKNRQFSLMWFGRGLTFRVYKQPIINNNSIYVTAQITSRKITLPIDKNGNYFFTKLIIKDTNDRFGDPYYEATLERIGNEVSN